MTEEITFLGKTTFRNEGKKFGIKTADRRSHIYIIGKTGSGKSELLFNMMLQDINRGKGLAFFDPDGDLTERLLDFIPQRRINDVVYFNATDVNFPIAFNIIEKGNAPCRNLVSSNVVASFKKAWSEIWSPQIEYILTNCIAALLEYPSSTILGIQRILTDRDYRQKVIEKITNPVTKAFWVNEFPKYNQREDLEAIATIKNKISQIVSILPLRNILGQVKSNIDFREIVDQQKIFIVNLSRIKLGEDNTKILGIFLFTKLYLDLICRIDIPEEERKDFYLYIDEFQNFSTRLFVNLFSDARKHHLNLVLTHQYLGQLTEVDGLGRVNEIRDAIFGNVGTIICFNVGAEDARFLAQEFYPEFTAEDLMSLPKYHIYLKLMVDGVPTRPFSAVTLPPPPKIEESNKEKIIKVSRERYGTPRQIIEEKLCRWAGV